MKFRSLKFITTTIMVFSFCAFITACSNESGNNSTTTNSESDTSSKTNVTSPTDTSSGNLSKTMRRTGRASTKMIADANAKSKIEKDKMGYYTASEVLPAYNGGQTALENYITNNIEYPEQAIDNSVEGTVSVQFLVDDKGNISNVSTVGNKLGYGLEEEAIKVVSKMPKWTPGQVKGKSVKTWRTLPITYKLES